MLFTIAGFEIKSRFKRASTYVYFVCLFALACLWIAAAGGVFQSANVSFGAKININSPFAVAQTITVLGYLGLMIITAVMGRAVQQDFESDIHHFFFSAPISKWQYLGGRFRQSRWALSPVPRCRGWTRTASAPSLPWPTSSRTSTASSPT
jgi:ABC-2 type transport system permease protein